MHNTWKQCATLYQFTDTLDDPENIPAPWTENVWQIIPTQRHAFFPTETRVTQLWKQLVSSIFKSHINLLCPSASIDVFSYTLKPSLYT